MLEKSSKSPLAPQFKHVWLDEESNSIIEKIFNLKKSGIGIESEKYANKLEIKKVWKQVKDGAQ